MTEYMYDSFCGLYCNACEIMQAYKNGKEGEVAHKWGAKPEQIVCHGCKSDKVFMKCRECKNGNNCSQTSEK